MLSDSGWLRLDHSEDLHTAQYAFPGGISRTVIGRIADDAVVVYSAGRGLAESARALIGADDRVFVLVPSRSHMMGVMSWVDVFPDAIVVASGGARERAAARMPSLTVHGLDALLDVLPSHVAVHVLPGIRSDEVWLSVRGDGITHWMVCDVIMNVTRPPSRVRQLLLWLYGIRYGLDTSRMIQRAGFVGRGAFRPFASALFAQGGRPVIVPCHGEVFDRPDGQAVIEAMLARRF